MTTESLKNELREMEALFCETANKLGAAGWAQFFAEDGAMVNASGAPIVGPSEIEKAMSGAFSLPEFKLVWKPLRVDVSPDGQLGYTYGEYLRIFRNEAGVLVESTGKYMTIWKRQPDGQWKISADIGN